MTNFKFIKNHIGNPKFHMADGAWEITNGAKNVFGLNTIRLMCYSHAYRNIHPKLAPIRTENKTLGESILSDIEAIQWMCQTPEEFKILIPLLKQHYLSLPNLSLKEISLLGFEWILNNLTRWVPLI